MLTTKMIATKARYDPMHRFQGMSLPPDSTNGIRRGNITNDPTTEKAHRAMNPYTCIKDRIRATLGEQTQS